MTELERKVIKQFINDKTLTFYGRYVDDTLVAIKPEDLNCAHNALKFLLSTHLTTLFPIF